MDIDTQLESRGYGTGFILIPRSLRLTYYRLPTHFGTVSDQPEDSHIAENAAASVLNSGTPIAPNSELNLGEDSAAVSSDSTLPQVGHLLPSTVMPAINGLSQNANVPAEPLVNDSQEVVQEVIPSLPDSQPPPSLAPPVSEPQPDFVGVSVSMSSVPESIPESSIPAEKPSSEPTTDPSASMMEAEHSVLPQPMTSDLRTLPHADDLTSAQIAEVEAQKHAEDNAVDTTTAAIMEATPMYSTSAVASSVPEPAIISDAGLATPPMQSPPPPPQPASAELPAKISAAAELVSQPTALLLEPPSETTPILAEPASVAQEPQDSVMQDLPSPPAKIAREREEDEADVEPAAKRVKTDEEQDAESLSFKVPEVPAAPSPSQTNGSPAPTSFMADGDESITTPRLAHMKKIISNLKKSNASQNFRTPVDYVALNIPSYPEVVKTPMDLGQIDNKLKQQQYKSVSEFTDDFELIILNCIAFNGREHVVTQGAVKMQTSFNNQMANLPKAQFAEPSKEEKRAARIKAEPTRTAPPRRPSVTAPVAPTVGTVQSPKAATPSAVYAPSPDGMPLIRRESAMDGRPKRAIVPSKRNQESFSGGRPKKKKYELQLRFCQEVIKEIASSKHWQLNQYFTHPVDPVSLNIPTYFQLVKKPMDLGTVQTKLDSNVYEKAKDFEEDVRLVFKNCYKFNPEGDFVNQCGHQLEDLFDKKWETKDDWIAAREPASDPPSDEEDDDQEDSEDDAEDSEDERSDKIAALQKQIEMMSKQMGELTNKKPKKKSKSPNELPKKSKSKSAKKEKTKASFPNLKPDKSKKATKPRAEKERYVTFAEKQYISNGIGMLPEKQMAEALRIIQQSVPSLGNSDTGEVELDIEEVPNHALLKLLSFVKKYAGPPPDEPKTEADYSAPAPSKKKKGPISKSQQEAQIAELNSKLDQFATSALSPNAVQSVETGDSSDDDDNSDESEEE